QTTVRLNIRGFLSDVGPANEEILLRCRASSTSVETATINYRVADFLKKHPPFPAMDEGDLLTLAGRGRVKFFEANEYIVVQGDPYRLQVLVIQQGTVTLWDE